MSKYFALCADVTRMVHLGSGHTDLWSQVLRTERKVVPGQRLRFERSAAIRQKLLSQHRNFLLSTATVPWKPVLIC